ncbi:MAG: HAD-IB family phosphatase [Cyanobacteria bacterium P01_A01_bin.84]
MKRIVFCDFDATITIEETFVAILKKFAPEVSGQLIPQMYAKELSLRRGVRQILESIPASCYPEIIEFSRNKTIRPGFVKFLDFLDTHHAEMVVVSGGLRGIVEVVMGNLVHRVKSIYAVDVNTTQQYLQIYSEFEGDTELVAKVEVMKKYPVDEKIAIGDSITDLNMALQTPLVFARDRLCHYLDERNKPYVQWQDFFEIRDYLAQKWKLER